MTRRAWLAFCAACCVARPAPAGAAELAALFSDPGAARRLGLAYAGTEGASADGLAVLVQDALSAGGTLRARVAAAVEADFAAGRLACVDGWLLSLTEARLCALAALVA